MFRFLLLAFLLTCSLGAETLEKRPRLEGRIVGGRRVYIHDVPYQVSVLYGSTQRCSGAIISHDWAITAGQCIDGLTPANVWFGSEQSSTGGGILHNVTQLILHPNYDYYILDSDIGLAQVAYPFIYGIGAQPIKLKSVETTTGAPAVVTGWVIRSSGTLLSNDGLQAFPVDIIDRYDCYNNYGYAEGIIENTICAVGDAGGANACLGDAGAPLVVGNLLVGLLSWGLGCGGSNYPTVYTNIANFKHFVTDNTGVE